jgi:hypothetical protein
MIRPLFKLLGLSIFALAGETGHLWRLWLCVLAGAAITVAMYWLSPAVLSLWPGVATLSGAVGVGTVWEWRAYKSAERMVG